MFCYNCGNKVDDDASFCSKCGTKIRRIVESSTDGILEKQVQINNVNYDKKNQNNSKQEKSNANKKTPNEIRKIAEKYFSGDVFGKKTYLFDINDEDYFVKDITRYYSLEKGEEPLFIFNYKENYEQGFLITTRRMIWKYDGLSSGDWSFYDIGAIDNVKYMSIADALMLFDKSVTKYSSRIILTHIADPELFIFRLALFLTEINPTFGCGNKLETILRYVVISIGKVYTLGITWKKLNPPRYYEEPSENQKELRKKSANKIRTNLLIEQDETLFWGHETNNSGSNMYAFTEYGVYYKNSNDTGFLSWEEFKNSTIKMLDKRNIAIGKITLEFEASIKEHFKLLNNLQDAIKWNWERVFSAVKPKVKNNVINKVDKFILDNIPQNISLRYDTETSGLSEGVDPIKFNRGNSVRIDKQVVAMKEALNIEAEKNVFMMVSGGVFGNYGQKSKGFAIVEDGFYYRNDLGEVGVLSWEKYLEQKIYLDIFVYVGKNGFNIVSDFKMPILNLLSGLQMYISDCINNANTRTIIAEDDKRSNCNEPICLENSEPTKVEKVTDLSEEDAISVLKTFATIFHEAAAYGVNCPILFLDKDENDVFSMSCNKINYLNKEKILMIYSIPQYKANEKAGERGLVITDQSIYIWNKERTVRWSFRDIVGVRIIQDCGFFGIGIISKEMDEEKDKTTIIFDYVNYPGDLIARIDLFVKCVAISVFNYSNIYLDRIGLFTQATILSLRRSSKDCIVGNPFVGARELDKIDKARANMGIPNNANIFVMIDGSVFGRWKCGVAFCDIGIVYSMSSPILWTWDNVMNVKIEVNEIGSPTINGKPIFTSRDKEIYRLLTLLSDITYVCYKKGNLI